MAEIMTKEEFLQWQRNVMAEINTGVAPHWWLPETRLSTVLIDTIRRIQHLEEQRVDLEEMNRLFDRVENLEKRGE